MFSLAFCAARQKRHFSLVHCALLLHNCLYLLYLSLGTSQLLLSSVRSPRGLLRICHLAYQPINFFNHSQKSSLPDSSILSPPLLLEFGICKLSDLTIGKSHLLILYSYLTPFYPMAVTRCNHLGINGRIAEATAKIYN